MHKNDFLIKMQLFSLLCSFGFSVHGNRLTTLVPSFEGQTTN